MRSTCRASPIAQLVERAAVNLKVAGSNPAGRASLLLFAPRTSTPLLRAVLPHLYVLYHALHRRMAGLFSPCQIRPVSIDRFRVQLRVPAAACLPSSVYVSSRVAGRATCSSLVALASPQLTAGPDSVENPRRLDRSRARCRDLVRSERGFGFATERPAPGLPRAVTAPQATEMSSKSAGRSCVRVCAVGQSIVC